MTLKGYHKTQKQNIVAVSIFGIVDLSKLIVVHFSSRKFSKSSLLMKIELSRLPRLKATIASTATAATDATTATAAASAGSAGAKQRHSISKTNCSTKTRQKSRSAAKKSRKIFSAKNFGAKFF